MIKQPFTTGIRGLVNLPERVVRRPRTGAARPGSDWQKNGGQKNNGVSASLLPSVFPSESGNGDGIRGANVGLRSKMNAEFWQKNSSGHWAGALVDGAALSGGQRDANGNRVSPESGWGFDLQGADGEVLIRQECPEIGGGRGRGQRPADQGGASVNGTALSRHQWDAVGNSELPESRCNFVLQGADEEVVMRTECPEIGGEG
jgi:hypothetical protein